jgi:hypothetical protein
MLNAFKKGNEAEAVFEEPRDKKLIAGQYFEHAYCLEEKGDYHGAYQNYKAGLEILLAVIRAETNPEDKQKLTVRMVKLSL